MIDRVPYPYSVELEPCEQRPGHFHWKLRRHGSLLERSMRPLETAELAEKRAMQALDRVLRDTITLGRNS
jgi:hypothetical protein